MRKWMFMAACLAVGVVGCGGASDTATPVDEDRPTDKEIEELDVPEIEVGSETDLPGVEAPDHVAPAEKDPDVVPPVEKDIFGEPAEKNPGEEPSGDGDATSADSTKKLDVPELVARLGDLSSRDEVAAQLARRGKEAVPALIRALDDDDPTVRSGAAFSLSLIGADAAEALAALKKTADDKSEVEAVRVAAQFAIDAVQGR